MTSDDPPSSLRSSERVLVFVRGARNAATTRELLAREGLEATICASVAELVAEMEAGAAVALLEEEALPTPQCVELLGAALQRQPPWSDFPILVFSAIAGSPRRTPDELVARLGNVVFLDRPVRARSMLASVRAAIRSRRRQYEGRRAIEARDMFLAMLGHELRNPLGAIRLATTLLESKSSGAALPKELAVIDRQTSHLTSLVDDLLDVARVTQGKVVLKRERLRLDEIVKSAFEAQEAHARERGLSYELRPCGETIYVDGDRQRLEQVLANLLANAIKYTRRGGTVVLSYGLRDGQAVVEVTDTGVGIAPDMLGRVFDAFTQADRTLDRTEGGIGLGLAVVRSLVELHGGTASATSAGVNRGSSFVVRLPALTDASAPAPTSRGDLDGETRARRVVVVEDSPDARELLAELLEREGHEVSCASDGPRGLEALVRVAPDVAFIDIGLPGFDGLELARRARASGVVTTLVAVTGYGQPVDRERAFDAGFDDHLTKPVVPKDLQRVMLRVA